MSDLKTDRKQFLAAYKAQLVERLEELKAEKDPAEGSELMIAQLEEEIKAQEDRV